MSEDLAWAAGFFDGEGHTRMYSAGIRMEIAQAYDCTVLERFQKAVGAGKVYGPYTNAAGNPKWQYVASGRESRRIVLKLWPWLGVIKRNQIIAAARLRNTPQCNALLEILSAS